MGKRGCMLTYELDRAASEALYLQLYRAVRADIERGAIRAHEKLPSNRKLAQHLGVSVMTVEEAFAQLVAEGYVEARPRSGHYACEVGHRLGPTVRARAVAALEAAEGGANLGKEPSGCKPIFADFTGASAPQGLFPYDAWARTMRRVLSEESEATLMEAGTAAGSARLRAAIAAHLHGSRGMEVDVSQIVVGSGVQSLYGLVVQLLGRGRMFAIENPGYPRLERIYRANDVRLGLVGLDAQGPRVDQLECTGASVLHCMPSHQLPTGIVTTVGRRRDLLAWAASDDGTGHGRYLVEDDYDCEFRMAGRPVPALQSLDGQERVIYANTFTNTLGPAFRIGYLVLPPHLARDFHERLGFYRCTVGALEQLTLARFIESGQYERHVNRQRTHFRKVQEALVERLAVSSLSDRARVHNAGAGLHFLLDVRLKGKAPQLEQQIVAEARSRGVALAPLSDYLFREPAVRLPSFVLRFASLSEGAVQPAVEALEQAIAQVLVHGGDGPAGKQPTA